jgi:Mg-chelatase subunit ChlD
MKIRTFFISLILLLVVSLAPSRILAAPSSQAEPEEVIQIVLVLDVSGSMGTPVFSGIVPEDLLTLLLRMREIENDPDFIGLNETIEAAREDPTAAAAEIEWTDAFDAMSDWVTAEYGKSIPEVRNEVREALEAAGCQGHLDQAIATAANANQIDVSLSAVCPSGAITTELKQAIAGLTEYTSDSEYRSLRQAWIEASGRYDDALEVAGFPSAQQQLDDYRAGVGFENIRDEIDRLVEAYNIPSRLELAKSAAINLIELSRLDKVNTGRDSLVGLVTFTNEAMLEHDLTLDHEALRALIQKWTPQQQTNIGDALLVGLNELSGGADPDQPMLVILLSDGHANRGMLSPEILAAIPPRANGMGATICTAGFADFEAEVDVVLLDGLAEQTEGEYLFTNSGAELASFFVACRESVAGKDLLGQITDIVQAGEQKEVGSVEIPANTCELSFALNFLSGTPNIQLFDSVGTSIGETAAGVNYQKGENVQLLSVDQPNAGEWDISVSNDDSDGTAAVFSIVISAERCEGPLAAIDQAVPLQEPPFLLSEDGMPFVTGGLVAVVVMVGVGAFFVIRRRGGGIL